jgi:hypothetical protein
MIQQQEALMAELTEQERKDILGVNYRPLDPDAPKAPLPWYGRLWAALFGKSNKS